MLRTETPIIRSIYGCEVGGQGVQFDQPNLANPNTTQPAIP